MKRIVLILVLALSCDGNNFAPSPINTHTTATTTIPVRPPRVDQQPDLYSVRGVTAFGAPLLSEPELLAYINHVQASAVNMLRAGAQTDGDGWCGSSRLYLDESCGPAPGTVEWRQNLTRFLDVTSRVPGLSVQLIPTFTHKGDGYQRCAEIMEMVIEIQRAGSEDDPRPYEHVVWEAVNEWRHPLSKFTVHQVTRLLQRLRETGQPVGVDFDGGEAEPWEGYYPTEHLPYIDYIAFHPPRHDDCEPIRPSRSRLRKVISSFGLPVWIEEPTAYLSDESKTLYGIGDRNGHYAACGGRSDGYRRRLTQEYADDVVAAGGVWFTHHANFKCDRLGWLPN